MDVISWAVRLPNDMIARAMRDARHADSVSLPTDEIEKEILGATSVVADPVAQ